MRRRAKKKRKITTTRKVRIALGLETPAHDPQKVEFMSNVKGQKRGEDELESRIFKDMTFCESRWSKGRADAQTFQRGRRSIKRQISRRWCTNTGRNSRRLRLGTCRHTSSHPTRRVSGSDAKADVAHP
jgi:hypothetical protein